jgi:hypothetical protein
MQKEKSDILAFKKPFFSQRSTQDQDGRDLMTVMITEERIQSCCLLLLIGS